MFTYTITTSTGDWVIPRFRDGIDPSHIRTTSDIVGDDSTHYNEMSADDILLLNDTTEWLLGASSQEIIDYIQGPMNIFNKGKFTVPSYLKYGREGVHDTIFNFNSSKVDTEYNMFYNGQEDFFIERAQFYGYKMDEERYKIVVGNYEEELTFARNAVSSNYRLQGIGNNNMARLNLSELNTPEYRENDEGEMEYQYEKPSFVIIPVIYGDNNTLAFMEMFIANTQNTRADVINKPFMFRPTMHGNTHYFNDSEVSLSTDFNIYFDDLGFRDDEEEPEPEGGGCVVDVTERFAPRTNTSGIGIYNMTKGKLRDFMLGLWTTGLDEKMLYSINGNPTDSVISIKWYYGLKSSMDYIEDALYLQLGNVTFDGSFGTDAVVVQAVSSEYVQFECGELEVPRMYNNFLDYSPFSQLEIYIPFVGFVTLDINEFIDRKIKLTYSINIVSGAGVAHVYTQYEDGWYLIIERSCTMGVEIPLNFQSMESVLSRMATIAGGIGTAASFAVAPAFSLGAGAVIGMSTSSLGISNSLNPNNIQSGELTRSGMFDSETGSLTCLEPFIRIKRPITKAPSNYNNTIGQPDYRSGKLSKFEGYVKAGAVRRKGEGIMGGIPKDAMDEIEQLLLAGVYIE